MTTTHNVRFELLDGSSYERYMVRGDREVRFILKQLASRRANVSAYPDASGEFSPLAVLDVPDDAHKVYLDVSADPAINARLLAAQRLICVTQLDRVKIQFALGPLASVAIANTPAFQAAMPDALLRLQRREYFRLVAPVSHPVRCTISMHTPDGNVHSYDARVLDISAGGIALVAPPAGTEFSAGRIFDKVVINLPDSLPITVGLEVCNLFSVMQRNGTEMLRAGCRFIGLTPAQENAVQRYILRVERDRASRVAE